MKYTNLQAHLRLFGSVLPRNLVQKEGVQVLVTSSVLLQANIRRLGAGTLRQPPSTVVEVDQTHASMPAVKTLPTIDNVCCPALLARYNDWMRATVYKISNDVQRI